MGETIKAVGGEESGMGFESEHWEHIRAAVNLVWRSVCWA